MFTPTIPGPDPDTKIPKFKLPALACLMRLACRVGHRPDNPTTESLHP
jgi:hypothetical protein